MTPSATRNDMKSGWIVNLDQQWDTEYWLGGQFTADFNLIQKAADCSVFGLPSLQRKVAIASADAEPGVPPVPSEDKIEEARSLLYISLLGSVLSHGAFIADACSEENIPAEYWVNGSGDLLHMKFVVRLDFYGQYSRLGPYFNLFNSRTLKTLRNAGIPEVEAEHPTISGFVHDCFVLVVQSEPLLKDLPKEGFTVPRISCQDIGSVLLSPSKAKQLTQASAAARSSQSANTSNGRGILALTMIEGFGLLTALLEFLHIHDLHDPDNYYSGLGSLKETKVECPDVQDDKGLLIHPREYGIKLDHARFVEVEVYLKLYGTPTHLFGAMLTKCLMQMEHWQE
ncbi:uncharacterized protein EDB93DRAFT_1106302 [Suillus bovinus]|uniref:uncharacterized protein n=1 Tax=Suillus bovinus TaxID=48563 RepID=UPI001B8680F7|nr:uncharacterized protein EDB93DRAFT_1106302 [Suillus bovinus]KAG2138733.1 hypothetical protein EDB93DRAFT_1106302 [Suillus bovinus]